MNKVQRAVVALGAVTGLCLTPGRAIAQATTPSPFHAGQWGIEGNAYGTTGGVLRFLTPKTAVVLDAFGSHQSYEIEDTFSGAKSTATSDLLIVSLGLRRHTMIAPRIATTVGVAASAGTSRRHDESGGGGGSYHASSYGAGISVGAQYMLADHFAIGTGYSLSAESRNERSFNSHGSAFTASFEPLRASLYF